MDLFTSRFANRDLARLECQPVGIARGNPRYPTGYKYRKLWELAPSRETRAITNPNAAAASYRAGLDEIGVERIEARLRELQSEAGGLPLVLLCHEDVHGGGHTCHRRWFSRWFHEQTGQTIPELEPGMIAEITEVSQPRLL